MKTGEAYYGFEITSARYSAELGGTLYEGTFKKNGARLAYLDREDTNKTFAIAFKTIPEDSTGVFHIIEHSVLCGSDKYPVKEPFVELLKGSLNTFLNAMTYPDKTVYPVSSRNDKDFQNLVSIYMDAVFRPRAVTDPNIFRQEGWHYEINSEDEEPIFKGVVFNEMKGAYSSADRLAAEYMDALLYPDVCYGKDSGGDPEVIPELTYKQFCDSHARYYHPSNSRIFLDGKVNLDEILPIIASYIDGYDRLDVRSDIPIQPAVGHVERTVEFEIGESEDEDGKCRLYLGYLFGKFDQLERISAASIISTVLTGTNESPLKKALLSKGLCEDVDMYVNDGIQEPSLIIGIKNIKRERIDEAKETVLSVLREQAERGMDRENLTAALNRAEFKAREKDFGYPTGLVYGLSSLTTWLYGGDPMDSMTMEPVFAALREKLGTRYYEELLTDIVENSKNSAGLVMLPSKTIGERRRKKESDRLAAAKASWSHDELSDILKMNRGLAEWQKSGDTEAALATIPALTLSDIADKPEPIDCTVGNTDGVRVISHKLRTDGITYLSLLFDISGLDGEEITAASFLCAVLSNVRTGKHSVTSLQNEVKKNLGSLTFSTTGYTNDKGFTPYIRVSASALDIKRDFMNEIIPEVLYTSDFGDYETLRNLLRQTKIMLSESFTDAGHLAALTRCAAMITAEGAFCERTDGYEAYSVLKEWDKNFDKCKEKLSKTLADIAKRVFTRERLTVSLTSDDGKEFEREIISRVSISGEKVPACDIVPLRKERVGIAIPAQIAFALEGSNLRTLGVPFDGAGQVARNILNYEYLWNVVRVQGGAYGVGLILRAGSRDAMLYSYRDPSPARTLGCYAKGADFLREFAASGRALTKYIIGAVGVTDPLLSPRAAGELSTTKELTGRTYEDDCRLRRELIECRPEDILSFADTLDRMINDGAVCVVGAKEKLVTCELDRILEL